MEVIMSSPAQGCSLMEYDNGNGAAKLTKSQRSNRRKDCKKKLRKNLETIEKGEDTMNPKSEPEVQFHTISLSSIQDNPDTGLGTSATVDKKMAMSNPAVTGEEHSSDFKGIEHTEVANCEMGSSMITKFNGELKAEKKPGTTNGETISGTNATDNTESKKGKEWEMKNNNPDLGNILSTHKSAQGRLRMTKVLGAKSNDTVSGVIATPDAKIVSKEHDHAEVANGKTGENETTNLNVNGKRKRKKKQESENMRPTLGEILNSANDTISGVIATPDAKTVSKEHDHAEVANGKTGENETTSLDVNGKRKKKKKQKSEYKRPTLGEILNSRNDTISGVIATPDAKAVSKEHDHAEVAIGKTGENETTNLSVNGKRKRKKKQKSMNKRSTLGEILNSQVLQNLEAAKCEMDSGTKTHDANMVLIGDHTELANGMMGESETTNLNANGMKEKKKPKSKNKLPALGENLSPQYLQNLEAAKGEMGSGTTLTDNPVSKKQKRQKLNKNPDLGDILSTRESTQEGLSTTEILEVQSGEMVLAETGSSDANMVSKGDHTEEANGKMGESETTNFNVNGKEENKKKPKSENKQPTLGEILNLPNLQNMEAVKCETGSGTTSTGNTLSTKRKRKKLKNKKSDLGDILSTHENAQEGLSTTKALEVSSLETVYGKTVTPDVNMVSKGAHTEAANGKMGESANTNINVNENGKKRKKPKSKDKQSILGETMNPQCLELPEASDGATNSKNPEKTKSQDTIIMNKVSGKAESETGDLQEIANVENCQSTVADTKSTVLKSLVCPEVANSELRSPIIVLNSAEPANLEITEAKANNALARKRQEMAIKGITKVATLRKKLIILDVNGLLADVVSQRQGDIKPDKYIRNRAIYKRPYLDEFMRFCFERFNVGIWRNLKPVVGYLLGDFKKKLLFLWDGSKCTKSSMRTLEDRSKLIVAKDLRKIWDRNGPRWVKGSFHESNTLLVDDSPYKALLNPKHTGIFPASYSYQDRDDNFLGPKGDLRVYLEGLAAADDVQTYVEQHPFGQAAIDEQSSDWAFYSDVLVSFSKSEERNKSKEGKNSKRSEWLARNAAKQTLAS